MIRGGFFLDFLEAGDGLRAKRQCRLIGQIATQKQEDLAAKAMAVAAENRIIRIVRDVDVASGAEIVESHISQLTNAKN
jgi:hypothetical protein